MKIITCTGYHGTGSSSVTDLLKEYDNIACKGDYEITFLYEYQGINDLYHHLVREPVYNVGNIAIREFRNLCKKRAKYGTKMNYEKYFGGNFLKYTELYIQKLGNYCYVGHYEDDSLIMPRIVYYATAAVNKLYQKMTMGKYRYVSFSPFFKPGKRYLFTIDEARFIEETKVYLEKVLRKINNKEYLYIDHLVSPSSMRQCSKYFDDFKIVLVDRDPRDIYLLQKYYWKDLPQNDVRFFCKLYQWKRQMASCEESSSNVLKIRFEDMINEYEKSVRLIESFIGLKDTNHILRKKYFNPQQSACNTRLWVRHPDERDNIKYIEKCLEMYLYNNWKEWDTDASKKVYPW